jgi:hypothetical protein
MILLVQFDGTAGWYLNILTPQSRACNRRLSASDASSQDRRDGCFVQAIQVRIISSPLCACRLSASDASSQEWEWRLNQAASEKQAADMQVRTVLN